MAILAMICLLSGGVIEAIVGAVTMLASVAVIGIAVYHQRRIIFDFSSEDHREPTRAEVDEARAAARESRRPLREVRSARRSPFIQLALGWLASIVVVACVPSKPEAVCYLGLVVMTLIASAEVGGQRRTRLWLSAKLAGS